MIHPANVDAYRHGTGLFSDKVTHGLHEVDGWLAEIIRATKDAGIYEETDFFIVSDHGQLNIRRCVALNVLLAEKGLIDVDENGKMCLPGKGVTDFYDLFKRLNGVGFDGAFIIEAYKDDFKNEKELFESVDFLKEVAVKTFR